VTTEVNDNERQDKHTPNGDSRSNFYKFHINELSLEELLILERGANEGLHILAKDERYALEAYLCGREIQVADLERCYWGPAAVED
jgi:hypothetical protein